MSLLAVYDCMLFLRAALRPERVEPLFDFVANGKVTLCMSPDVLDEVRDVLNRPKLQQKFPALTAKVTDAFLAEVLCTAKWFPRLPEHYALLRDPKDSKYLNLAITAGAHYLVTTDLDLLDLMRPASDEGRNFRERYATIEVIEPREFIPLVR